MRNGRQGWHNESGRHSLAARGIRTTVELPPREEARFRYAFDGVYPPRELRSVIEGYIGVSEYEGFETPEGRSRFLNDAFNGRLKRLGWFDEDLESDGGLSYVYESDPPRMIVRLYNEEWYDSERDRIEPWDFTVMVSALISLVGENATRENQMKEYEMVSDKDDRWRISLRDLK